jgi:hypothetical protein
MHVNSSFLDLHQPLGFFNILLHWFESLRIRLELELLTGVLDGSEGLRSEVMLYDMIGA